MATGRLDCVRHPFIWRRLRRFIWAPATIRPTINHRYNAPTEEEDSQRRIISRHNSHQKNHRQPLASSITTRNSNQTALATRATQMRTATDSVVRRRRSTVSQCAMAWTVSVAIRRLTTTITTILVPRHPVGWTDTPRMVSTSLRQTRTLGPILDHHICSDLTPLVRAGNRQRKPAPRWRTMRMRILPILSTTPYSMHQVIFEPNYNHKYFLKFVKNIANINLSCENRICAHIWIPSVGSQLGTTITCGPTTPTNNHNNNYHHYANVDVVNNGGPPSNKWSLWQQFQWPVVPPEQNRWSKWWAFRCAPADVFSVFWFSCFFIFCLRFFNIIYKGCFWDVWFSIWYFLKLTLRTHYNLHHLSSMTWTLMCIHGCSPCRPVLCIVPNFDWCVARHSSSLLIFSVRANFHDPFQEGVAFAVSLPQRRVDKTFDLKIAASGLIR